MIQMKESNKYIHIRQNINLSRSRLLLLCVSHFLCSLWLLSDFCLSVCSVLALPSGLSVDFNNKTKCSPSLSRWKSVCVGLFNVSAHLYSWDNWVILTNPAQKLSSSMEMLSVWILVFFAAALWQFGVSCSLGGEFTRSFEEISLRSKDDTG